MVRLYLLGFTPDLKGVVFSQRKGGKQATFWVPIDASFNSAVDKLEKARNEKGGKSRSAKSGKSVVGLKELPEKKKPRLPPVGRSQPRTGLPASEIQQLLRSGRTVKNVAALAKTEVAWVERLAGPVATERDGVVRLAQRAYMVRPRLGTAGLQLGDAVRRNLEERRATADTIEGLDDAWDARVGASGIWRVWVRYSHRGRRHSAEWRFRKGSRQIEPRNRLAAEIGWWTPAPIPEPVPENTDDGENDESGDERPTGTRPTIITRPQEPTTRRRVAKRKAPARKPTTTRKKATARRRPARRRR